MSVPAVRSRDLFESRITNQLRKMNNLITTWQQGRFVDQPQYSKWTAEEKAKADHDEKYRVRPSPTGNAIAQCRSHGEAEWIASRLNLAATLEQMTYDYATGKTDGSEIVALVKSHILG